MLILAIDTSCDETSVAVSQDDQILANVISSQIKLHKNWGGVVPSLAQRAHRERIDAVIARALNQAGINLSQIELFAVTYGPGLAIALEVGLAKAKSLALQYNRPLAVVNHMVGHIYANLAKNRAGKAAAGAIEHPALALLVSGGHTELVLWSAPAKMVIIGQTLDDAMGEAYDKVAKMLGLGYPGGPVLAKLAQEGNPLAYPLPIPMARSGDLNWSFSGLKTAMLLTVQKERSHGRKLTKSNLADLAVSFQQAAFESILIKLELAIKQYQPRQLLLGGGVIANTAFRRAIRARLKPFDLTIHYPSLKKLCTDNAAMIAVAAYYQAQRGELVKDLASLDRDPSLSI